MRVLIEKRLHRLTVWDAEGNTVLCCAAALGAQPVGAKRCEGDGRTPEGEYRICFVKECGRYGRSLGLDYPSPADAERAFCAGQIDEQTLLNIRTSRAEGRRPPWGSPLGGEIYIHEGGCVSDWTQGCIALNARDMDRLWALRDAIACVEIRP